ncbi:hypothetical protein ACH5RR_009977 [Cinchona calisaya]|uniref:Uncharacterized protein n=1 Tax=Cinchona calisaya TaxID=153742 RepID=A0ABD3AIA0_9GENT
MEEDKALGSKNKACKNARIPPGRGQIKIKIFKMIADCMFSCGKTKRGGGDCLVPKPILPTKSAEIAKWIPKTSPVNTVVSNEDTKQHKTSEVFLADKTIESSDEKTKTIDIVISQHGPPIIDAVVTEIVIQEKTFEDNSANILSCVPNSFEILSNEIDAQDMTTYLTDESLKSKRRGKSGRDRGDHRIHDPVNSHTGKTKATEGNDSIKDGGILEALMLKLKGKNETPKTKKLQPSSQKGNMIKVRILDELMPELTGSEGLCLSLEGCLAMILKKILVGLSS